MEILSDEDETAISDQREETKEKETRHQKKSKFDRRLPIIHSYLGDVNQGELSGQEAVQRSFEEPGNNLKVTALVMSELCLLPDQKTPIQFDEQPTIQFMANAQRQQKMFALFTSEEKVLQNAEDFSAILCHSVGTLFQVQNMLNNGSSDRLSIQVIGRQRCRLVSPLKRHQIHCEDSYVLICDLIEVVVLEERLLSSSLFTLNECCTFNKLRNDDKLKCKAALSAHTQFTLRQCSTEGAVKRLVHWLHFWFKQQQIDLVIQQGLTPFSFWVAANIPMSLETKLELLHEDCTDRRLRIEWRIVSQMDSMVCSKFGSNSMHFVNPSGYVHDLFTVRRVRGIEFTGQPSAEYTWTVMACSNCEQHLGWKFSSSTLIPGRFFGISRRSIHLNCFLEIHFITNLSNWFEKDVHSAIERMGIFAPGDCIGVGVSGGKDSTVLAHVLSRLNARHGYGLKLVLLCVDEGIKGYRDDSIREGTLWMDDGRNCGQNWSEEQLHILRTLDRAALHAACNKLATGHNADDAAETRMGAAAATYQMDGKQRCHSSLTDRNEDESLPRVKPLKYSYEKDIVIYSHFGKLNYFSTECVYAPNAYRSNVRSFVKELERIRPRAILDLVLSGESLRLKAHVSQPKLGRCERCGYIASQKLCKACQLLEGLNDNNATAETEPQKEEGSPAANDKTLKLDGEAMSLESCGRMECGCNTAGKLVDF
uniref:Lon N-terminal domain-containing protein n=1 Tax=Globodera rostochiensis TaxID=31243 RepID=A0A914HVP3_GLORO